MTDPDTRKMPTAHGTIVGYNAQVAVDAKHKLIAAANDVTNEGNDYQQLANVALAAKANLEFNEDRSGGRRRLLQRERSGPLP